MSAAPLQRRLIWSAPLRLSHWLLAASTWGMLLSGWLLAHVAQYRTAALETHRALGWVLLLALGLRLYLLFSRPRSAAGWHDLLPDARTLAGALATLRCYLSLGRTPLPRWYAHNPLWAPLYLLLFGLLALQAASGWLQGGPDWGAELAGLHAPLALAIGGFALAHPMAAFCHDLKSGDSDVSAMIHGYRIFRLGQPATPLAGGIQRVPLSALRRPPGVGPDNPPTDPDQ
ncbi:cytochrome b/b6 domain-containing protein [Thiohalobacter sp. IOR34]|uniref:cytochrome b/b6 domain-containing protein n=1 Tax=Thiohalobacter sp. IOR34 TaxID=3057176 RepID=UPI0025B094DA|nr:cytochrome b/b6 domain-containing protein [Thiohalobacter sp. IOR34]WJW74885.1 cytochrome b/b6 domain-containing protein [Thiohalobacter sp. IOR34]